MVSVVRYLPAARNREIACSIDRSRSEFKVGYAANCNKYPARGRARARAARLNCMRNNVSDIYRYSFSSFDLYPAPGTRSYIFRGTAARNKQQATTLLQVTPLILGCPSQPLALPFATENRNWKRDSCVVSQSSGPRANSSSRAPRNRDPARSNITARISLSVLPLRARTIQRRAYRRVYRARARVHLFVPLIYRIHSRFYLAPRTCVNSGALWNDRPGWTERTVPRRR